MGMGNANQVYFDPASNQYYTMGMNNQAAYGRNIIGGAYNQQPVKQKSPINELLAQSLAAKPNAPSLAQLFPGMSAPNMGGSQGILGQGQYGAGRFLGSNVMGNPSMSDSQINNNMPQQNQPIQPANATLNNPYFRGVSMTRGPGGYVTPYTNAGSDVWNKIIAAAPVSPKYNKPNAPLSLSTYNPSSTSTAMNT